jgi:peptidoglycan/LPS O-acetylase OafA/YrhL
MPARPWSPSTRDTGAPAARRTRHLLVAAEVAVSVMLLVCAGLLLRAFSALLRTDPGFATGGVASLELQLPQERYPNGEAALRFQDELRRRLLALPGVNEVGFVRQLPLTGSGPMQPYAWDDESARRWESVSADWRSATPGFFRALGVRLLAGRMFDERDDAQHPRVVIVASEAGVLRMVVAGGLRLALLGMVPGLLGALLCSRALATAIEGVRPGDASAWVGAPLLLLSVTLLACWLPARRAARVSPVVALGDG